MTPPTLSPNTGSFWKELQHKMESQAYWKDRYDQLMEKFAQQSQRALTQEKQDASSEVSFNQIFTQQWYVHLGPSKLEILDITPVGISFISSFFFPTKSRLMLNAFNQIKLDVEVAACTLKLVHEGLLEYQYVVNTHFAKGVNGYQMTVLCSEMLMEQVAEPPKPEHATSGEQKPAKVAPVPTM